MAKVPLLRIFPHYSILFPDLQVIEALAQFLDVSLVIIKPECTCDPVVFIPTCQFSRQRRKMLWQSGIWLVCDSPSFKAFAAAGKLCRQIRFQWFLHKTSSSFDAFIANNEYDSTHDKSHHTRLPKGHEFLTYFINFQQRFKIINSQFSGKYFWIFKGPDFTLGNKC